MNITFLIGNGFDINLGLKTRYVDFYDFYLVYDILINCTFYKSYDIIQTRQSEGPLYEIHA